MTQATPPGWYADPGQTHDGPRLERWWDGMGWTDHVRQAEAAGPWGPPTHPAGVPPVPYGAPGRRRGGLRTAIGAGVALVVLACIGGGVYALTAGGDGTSPTTSAPTPHPSPSDRPEGPSGPGDGQGRGPRVEDGYATDMASGVSLPVPKGWEGRSGTVGARLSTGPYACPGDPEEQCARGGVSSAPAAALKLVQTSARAAARADISKNAEQAYGGKVYGSISSHEELASKAVDVAGEEGYLVRWKVVTGKGDDGYVESLVFPSPADADMLVVVRFGFDVNGKAPGLSKMDEITKGIKEARGAGGGSGKQV